MKKILAVIVLCIASIVALFYFDVPLNLFRPVFHTDLIDRYASENDLDPLLVTALIKVESNFVRHARSERGAIGLMQLMPMTAWELAQDLGYTNVRAINLEDPSVNIRLGTLYLSRLLREFNGNTMLALAAYNAGMTTVRTWYRQNPLLDVETVEIPYPETRNYVNSVMKTYRWLKKIQKLQNTIRHRKS